MSDQDMVPENAEDYLMAYEDSADRVPMLWIHGFPLGVQLWDFQVEGLADIARLITPDLRGHGLSAATPPPYSMETYADDCVRLLDRMGVDGPVVVAGLSMGGYVAFEICRRHPERVGGLVLAATRAGADSQEAKDGRDKAAEMVKSDGVAALVEGMLPKLLAPETYEQQPALVEFVAGMMMETSPDGVVGALAAMRDRPDSTPDLAGLDVPALILHGADDQLIPVTEAEAMEAAMPQAELVVIPGAGHLPNLEEPSLFNDSVRTFLDQFYGESMHR